MRLHTLQECRRYWRGAISALKAIDALLEDEIEFTKQAEQQKPPDYNKHIKKLMSEPKKDK